MKRFLIYIYYGYYQIDYCLAPRDYRFYNITTGSALFTISILSYIASWVNLISLIMGHMVTKYIKSIEYWFSINMVISIGIVFFIEFFWLGKDFYIEGFRKLDKEPQYMKWGLFCASMIFGIFGVFCFIKSSFWVRDEIVKFFM